MESVTITRPVIVLVRVTEGYRKAAASEVRDAITRLEARLAQLEVQHKKILENKNPRESAGGLQQIEAERRKISDNRRQLAERLREIGRLADGQEVVTGRVESLVDVKLGDSWASIMSVEIVLQDGLVVEIRQGGTPPGLSNG